MIITATGATPSDPRVLVSANIHGPEICPTIVALRLIERVEEAQAAGRLKGTVVIYPSLNPTGMRAGSRHPQFENPGRTDPNRMCESPPPHTPTHFSRALLCSSAPVLPATC